MQDSATDREWATLLRAPGAGGAPLGMALAHAGSASALFAASRRQWSRWGLSADTCDFLAAAPAPEVDADLAWLAASGARLLPCTDPAWPPQLHSLRDAPPALYVLGDVSALSAPQLAVVGSRHPTAAGSRFARQISVELATAGFVITSGLAQGIDAAAHEGALAGGGRTVAVLGTGPDIFYPRRNAALAARIAAGGALVSEYPPGTQPRAHHFPRRNRLIAALAWGTLVVEAAARSGSLITARLALELGREVFAVPGSPLNPLAAGCLELLRDGAVLTRGIADVLEETRGAISNIQSNQSSTSVSPTPEPPLRLDKEYEMLLDALGFEPASINDLVDRTGLEPGSVASMMLILELRGRVEARPGALFNRVD